MINFMKKLIVFIICIFMGTNYSEAAYVHSHTRHNGTKITRVSGYHRTRSDKLKSNNYSTKGNKNWYTGKKGYKRIKKHQK